jgi:hypothetical protein
MNRHHAICVGLICLTLVGCLATLSVRDRGRRGPVYSVPQMEAYLARDARSWLGRTIVVHGLVVGVPVAGSVSRSDTWTPILVDAHGANGVDPLPLAVMDKDRLQALLRRLPWLGSRMPGEPAVHWGEIADFRIRLQDRIPATCGRAECYEAVVLGTDTR